MTDPDARWLQHTRGQAVDGALAERLHPLGAPVELLHTCAHGHQWRQQPDGGVSPSYGLAGTSIKFDGWDPARCPEPPRWHVPGDPAGLCRGIVCSDCAEVLRPAELLPGVSFAPWELRRAFDATGHLHLPPLPACGLPAARTRAWRDGHWIDVDPVDLAAPGDQLALI
jgi:hypothetical protein